MPSDTIYDDEFAEPHDRLEVYADFVAIVKQLRRDCPWDREQTHESVKHLLIEEAYEVVEAIDEEDWEALKKELGDIFLHVLFHSNIAEENETFTLKDVIEAETEKLVRRHPHVFGEDAADDAASVEANWEQIKMQERDGEKEAPSSVLDGVPKHLPALLRAHRMQEKAAGVGVDFPGREGAWSKVEEEIQEFREHLEAGASDDEKEDELGDVLFALVNYARRVGVNPENALRRTNDKFVRRFQHIERRLAESDRTVADVELAEADALWDEAKELEDGKG
jgi:XTP/dITP diphosphohydrolase/tetrapyrrole methylase family protein/MazG family protein